MAQITAEEYAIVKQALLKSMTYVEQSNRINQQNKQELQSLFTKAMGVVQEVNKRMKTGNGNAIPEGGSSTYCGCSTCKGEKAHRLLKLFGIRV
jgi:hypothetical protein